MNWYDVKKATLQKLFALSSNDVIKDENNARYLQDMPTVANEGLRLLASFSRGIVKQIEILHMPLHNLLGCTEILKCESGEIQLCAKGAKSIYFEASTMVQTQVFLQAENEILEVEAEILLNEEGGQKKQRMQFQNPQNLNAILKIKSENLFLIRNAAMYSSKYEEIANIPEGGENVKYNLRELAKDFENLLEDEVVLENEKGVKKANYIFEGDDVLILPRQATGLYRLWYSAQPPFITSETKDSLELPFYGGQAELLPIYMASQLYKEDDLAMAAVYRNEFEAGLEKTRKAAAVQQNEVFESGWV